MPRRAASASGSGATASNLGARQSRQSPRKDRRQSPARLPPPDEVALRGKTRLTMYLDMAVVEYFRSRAGGRGYQTLINEALRRAIEQENLENVLRRVIREEARPYQAGKVKP